MKKLFLFLIFGIICNCSVQAETLTKSQFIGTWVLSDNSKTPMPSNPRSANKIDKRTMQFFEDNTLVKIAYSINRVVTYEKYTYSILSDGTVVTYQQGNEGKFLGLANTFRVTFIGDVMHFCGFIPSPSQGSGEKNAYTLDELIEKNKSISLEFTLIDEWWKFEPKPAEAKVILLNN